MERFGKKLRDIRESLGLSAREVSEAVSLARTYIYEIEKGRKNPSLETVVKLSEVYNDPALVSDFMRAKNISDVRIDVSMSIDKQRLIEEFLSLKIDGNHKAGQDLRRILLTNEQALDEWAQFLYMFIAKYGSVSNDDSKK